MTDILPFLRTITDPDIARKAIGDVEYARQVIEALEFEPGCEGSMHPIGADGHEAEARAEWLRVNPCGKSMLVCAGRTQWLLERGPEFWLWNCQECGSHHQLREVRFIPLTPRSNP